MSWRQHTRWNDFVGLPWIDLQKKCNTQCVGIILCFNAVGCCFHVLKKTHLSMYVNEFDNKSQYTIKAASTNKPRHLSREQIYPQTTEGQPSNSWLGTGMFKWKWWVKHVLHTKTSWFVRLNIKQIQTLLLVIYAGTFICSIW